MLEAMAICPKIGELHHPACAISVALQCAIGIADMGGIAHSIAHRRVRRRQ